MLLYNDVADLVLTVHERVRCGVFPFGQGRDLAGHEAEAVHAGVELDVAAFFCDKRAAARQGTYAPFADSEYLSRFAGSVHASPISSWYGQLYRNRND